MYNDYYKMDNDHIVSIGLVDDFTESPRDVYEDSNLGTFLTWLNHYYSPDENDYPDFVDFLTEFDVYPPENDMSEVIPELIKKADEKGYFLFPVYVYEHSAITYSINQTIPSGIIGGVIFVEKEKIFQETNLNPSTKNLVDEVKKFLASEVEEYNDWANGDVMQYTVYNLRDLDEDYSSGHFYGDDPSKNGLYLDLGFKPNSKDYLGNYDGIEECIGNLIMDGTLKIKWQ